MLCRPYDRLRTFSFYTFSVFVLVALAAGLTACHACCAPDGGTPEQDIPEDPPEWFMNPPEDPHYVYGVQSATADGAKKALDKATTNARAELFSQVQKKIERMAGSFTDEAVGHHFHFNHADSPRVLSGQILRGTSLNEQAVHEQDDGTYRAFVLLELPIGKAAQEFLSKLKQNEEAYRRFRDSEAFDKMCEAIRAYDEEVAQERECGDGENE